jgi:hypothetical protein
MKSIFEVGDIVYHFRYGVGEIVELGFNCNPLVKFKDERPNAGKYHRKEYVDEDLLSFKKYTIEGLSHERPKSELEL